MQFIVSIAAVLVVASGCFLSVDILGYRVVSLLLLMTVSFIAMLFEILPVLFAAILSAVIWNFFFIPPIFTFHINTAEDVLMFLLYFLIALVNAVLTFKIRNAENKARDKEEKENSIKLYNTLLNSLSHELRTPISAILAAVETLQDNRDKLSTDIQIELLSEIHKAGIRLNRQVENLLNMSRLESGMLKLKVDWCDINELIFSIIQKNFSDHQNWIQFDPVENLPFFKFDRGLVEQIVYNLLHNAIQHTPGLTAIKIEALLYANTCMIRVEDCGGGFPENEIEFAFQKFYRSPAAKVGGSGLGLSIVKGFVEAHHGTVKLENLPGGGAGFTVKIPAETSFLNNLKNE